MNNEFPMRINKYLAHKGFTTRRGADALIQSGKVTVNGKKAVLGAQVKETDNVEIASDAPRTSYVYYAYNKPVGVITHSPAPGEKDIKTMFAKKKDVPPVFPIGRLDKASSGLILMTNDGRVTDRLLNPTHEHERTYRVTVDKRITPEFQRGMERGVKIEREKTRPAKMEIEKGTVFTITLTEGKKHQIRRMCAALGYTVVALERIEIMNIKLGNLKSNEHRLIEGKELALFLRALDL